MARFVFIGAISAGKTTLFNALRGVAGEPMKTQAVEYDENGCMDTPGEFFSHPFMYNALINTTAEADILVYVHAADDPECRMPSGLLDVYNERRIIGVITKVDLPRVDLPAVHELLRSHGIPEPIFEVSGANPASLTTLQAALQATY